MSGLAVVFQRDGAPASRELLSRMTETIAHRGPDGIRQWVDGPVGLGHCAFHTLPEDVGQTQPIASGDGQLHLTFDGRIDNRDELIGQLGLEREVSDARVVLAAYEKWGEYCPERLLGDFAFALWDGRERKLFCARDIMGIRPFFYYLSEKLFLAGSERAQLFQHPAVTRVADELMVAGHLMFLSFFDTRTLHRDVLRLAPATCAIITVDAIRTRRYWDIHEFVPEIGREKSDAEYADELWSLIVESTRSRLRAVGPVGLFLSGGLDSSSIAAAMRQLQLQAGFAPRLSAYSLTFPEWPEADETARIQSTVNRLDFDLHLSAPAKRQLADVQAVVERGIDLPDLCNDAFLDQLRITARDRGTRVLLNGLGGDEWFSGSDFQLLDWWNRGELRKIWRQTRIVSGLNATKSHRHLGRFLFRPLAARWCLRAGFRIKPISSFIPAHIDPHFAIRCQLREALLQESNPAGRAAAAQHPILQSYESGKLGQVLEAHGRLNSRFSIEARHPFHDRRLIEFGLRLPPSQLKLDDRHKLPLRYSLSGRIDDSIRNRTDKADFTRHRTLEQQSYLLEQPLDRLTTAEFGWVQEEIVQRMFANLVANATRPDYCPKINIWQVFALETMARLNCIASP